VALYGLSGLTNTVHSLGILAQIGRTKSSAHYLAYPRKRNGDNDVEGCVNRIPQRMPASSRGGALLANRIVRGIELLSFEDS
jgi:hypothetical protein